MSAPGQTLHLTLRRLLPVHVDKRTCGSVGYVDTRLDCGEVINFNTAFADCAPEAVQGARVVIRSGTIVRVPG